MQNYKILNVPQMKLHFKNEDSLPRTLSMLGGALLVDEETVPAYYGNGFFYWESPKETGYLQLHTFGLMGNGFIERDGIRHEFLATAENQYNLTYTGPNGDVTLKLALGVDYTESEGSMLYCNLSYCPDGSDIPVVTYQHGDPEQNILLPSLNRQGLLHVDVDLSTLWSSAASFLPEGFHAMKLSLDFDSTYNSANGTVTETTLNEGSGKTFSLSGKMLLTDQLKALRQKQMRFQADARTNARLKASFLANPQNGYLLSIDNLFSLPQPSSTTSEGTVITGQAQVQSLTVEALYYLAVYHTADIKDTDVTYQDMFGVTKAYAKERVTDIDPDILSLLSDSEVTDFLEAYAKTSLGNAFASSSDSTIKDALSGAPDAFRRCQYYLADGKHDTSMAKNAGYNKATAYINKCAYAHLVPHLKDYYQDGKSWAEQLYQYSMKRLAMLRFTDFSGSPRITHICMMLNFLDDSSHDFTYQDGGQTKTASLPYSAALYAHAFNLSLSEISNSVAFDQDGKVNFLSFMEVIFGVIYDELQKEKSDKIAPEILKELKEGLTEFGITTKKDFIDSCLTVTEDTMSAAGSFYDIISCITWIKNKFADSPRLNYCGKIASIGIYAFSLFNCVKMFCDWKELTDTEKAESVILCVTGVLNAGETVARWMSLRTLLSDTASPAEKINAATRLKFGGEDFDIISGMGRIGGTELEETMENAGRYVASIREAGGAAADAAELTNATKLFRVGEILLRILNILVLAFIVVVAAIDINDDFKLNRSDAIKAIDTLNVIFTGVSLILEVVSISLDLAGIVCDAIPVVGAICMFIGLVFSITGEILKMKDKPEAPAITFIKNQITPFIKTLETPPESWKPELLTA